MQRITYPDDSIESSGWVCHESAPVSWRIFPLCLTFHLKAAQYTKASTAIATRLVPIMSHFLFVAGALRERTSEESAELQLGHGLWGLCTGLIRTNLQSYLDAESRGVLYVLKAGLCAEFQIVSPVRDFSELDSFLSDELRTEARFGFVRIAEVQRFACSSAASQALLLSVLQIADQAELARRLRLGMHRLTQAEYDAIMQGVTV